MNTFVISDTHFNHKNIIEYCNRPFTHIDSMNQALIDNWNEIVTPTDIVYHLGDFAFNSQDEANTPKLILSELNGYKILVRGNHDPSIKKCIEMGWNEVYNSYEYRLFPGKSILLNHKPVEPKDNRYSDFCIHGHTHNKPVDPRVYPKNICVSVELIDYRPIRIEEVIDRYDKSMVSI